MREFKKIAVFCGASTGNNNDYIASAKLLGEEMVRRRVGLVYGGGNVGLMGAIAETVSKGLGEQHVIGVIPRALAPLEVRIMLVSVILYRLHFIRSERHKPS